MNKRLLLPITLFLIVIAATGCWVSDEALRVVNGTPRILYPDVIAVYPHDDNSYTQGLLWHDGVLYESAGLYGESDVRRVDLETGDVLAEQPLEAAYFAEGLALNDDTDELVQITWREGVAFVYDRETFEVTGTFNYTGEGWGLCYDGDSYWMTDGSSTLFERDAETFEVTRVIDIALDGQPISNLNELECVGDSVYMNIWYQDFIVRVSKSTGQILDLIDVRFLLTDAQRATLPDGAVLNGIAYIPERNTFLITGKLWPAMYEVTFETADSLNANAAG